MGVYLSDPEVQRLPFFWQHQDFGESLMNTNEPVLPYWPAALDAKMAAAYCGLSVETFLKVCPLKPVAFTDSARGNRYFRQRIDEWLLSIDPNRPEGEPRRRFGDRLSLVDRLNASPQPEAQRRRKRNPNVGPTSKFSPEVTDPKGLADRWECTPRHVRNIIVRGELPAVEIGSGMYRIRWADIETFERNGGSLKRGSSD